jgi:hypothetical protein
VGDIHDNGKRVCMNRSMAPKDRESDIAALAWHEKSKQRRVTAITPAEDSHMRHLRESAHLRQLRAADQRRSQPSATGSKPQHDVARARHPGVVYLQSAGRRSDER